MAGHVFVLQGDLTRLACDDWLLPCSRVLHVSRGWWTDFSRPHLEETGCWNSHWHGRPDAALVRTAWGDEGRAIPLRGWPTGAAPRPWLVDTVGGSPSLCAERVTAFVEAVVRADGAPYLRRRTRLLALPVIGTGAGGQYQEAGAVLVEVMPALRAAARAHGVDIALVTKGDAHHAAAQHLRESGDAWAELPAHLQRAAQTLARRARAGQLVLFLGAGVSMGAGLPSWDALLTDLAKQAGLTAPEMALFQKQHALDRAEYVAQRLTDAHTSVGEAVVRALADSQHYGLSHGLLAGLPFTEAVTTNYDRLFEVACEAAGRPVAVLPHDPATRHERWLLKMHGCVLHPEDIILTRQNYLRYAARNAALAGIVQAMLITKHMCFLGFSLRDDNFLRIVDEVRRAVRPGGTAVEGRPGHRLGTALMLFENRLLQSLWTGDIDWVTFEEEEDERALRRGSRLSEIFLDYLGARAAVHHHLLDERFTGALDAADIQLRALLEPLAEAPPEARESRAWPLVARLLKQLGGTS